MEYDYQCVMCNGELSRHDDSVYICKSCNRTYPVIDGITIIIPKFQSAMISVDRYLRLQSAKYSKLQELPYTLEKQYISRNEIDRILHAIQANLNLVAKHCEPINDYLQTQKMEPGLLDWFYFMHPTMPYDYMLRYFYQDWYGTENFKQVKELVINGVLQHCNDKKTAVVLGSAACGILYELSKHFDVSHGFDVDIATMMTASEMLKGENISIYPENAEWREIALKAPEKTKGSIALAATNIMRLPLPDSSVSLVVTQYMMDLDSNNPGYLAREMNRILSDDGIWINFSIPFRLPGSVPEFGAINKDGLPVFMDQCGFALADFKQVRFKAWNFEAVTDTGAYPNHEVHFYVATKNRPVGQAEIYSYFSDYFSGRNNDLLRLIPKTLEDRALSTIDRVEFKEGKIDAQFNLGVKLAATHREFPIGEPQSKLIHNILSLIDGKHTLSDIYMKLADQYNELTEEELVEFFHALSIYYYFIKFIGVDND